MQFTVSCYILPIGNSYKYTVKQDRKICKKTLSIHRIPFRKRPIMNSFGNIIKTNRKNNHLSQQALVNRLAEEGIEITTKALSKWETDAREPSLSAFFTICRILNIRDLYEAVYGENPYDVMDGLNAEGKDKAFEYINLLKAAGMFKPKKAHIVEFPSRYMDIYRAVSAGTGQDLSDALKETYDVRDLAPAEANFAVRISGDSMEPEYHDGEIAWVKQTEEIENGQTGIFFLNGDGFIKQYRNDETGVFLVSLNTKYPPIRIHEGDSFRAFGYVLGSIESSLIEGYH